MPTDFGPKTYRVSPFYWLYNLGGLGIIEGFLLLGGLDQTLALFSVVVTLLIFLACLCYGLYASWDIYQDGFSQSLPFGTFQVCWREIERLELKRKLRNVISGWGIGSTYLSIYQSSNEGPEKMLVTWMRKRDLREFVNVLKAKAPHAKIDSKILEYVS